MLKLKVEAEGKTEGDLTIALDEVKKKVEEGFTSGQDSNDASNYFFDVSGDKPLYVRDILDRFPILYDYDYKWKESDKYRDMKELLKELGYKLIDDEVKSGDYNDIKGYFGCEIKRIFN